MRRRGLAAAATLFAALCSAPSAGADERAGPPTAAAAAAGLATIFVPLTIGSIAIAQNDALDRPQGPFLVIDAGLALAPLVAHGLVGEWERGLAFAAVSSGAALATSLLLESSPELIQHGHPADRVLFGALFTLTLFSSAVGIADCLSAGERAAPPRLTVSALGGRAALGLALGGPF